MKIIELYRRWRRHSTPVLAVLATLLLVWSTVVIFDVPVDEVLGFLLVSMAGVAIIMVLAFALGWLIARLRR